LAESKLSADATLLDGEEEDKEDEEDAVNDENRCENIANWSSRPPSSQLKIARPATATRKASPVVSSPFRHGEEDDMLSPASSMDEREGGAAATGQGDVEVSLIESTVGILDNLAERYYVVEESGDDEDEKSY